MNSDSDSDDPAGIAGPSAAIAVVHHATVFRSAALGAVLGIDAVGHCIALATLCFAGGLVGGLGLGATAFVLGSVIVTISQTMIGKLPLSLAISQDTSISLLAPAAIAAGLMANGPVEANVITTFAVLGLSAVVSGLLFWAVGRFRLGRIVRAFPYPVAAGFLASSGCLLVMAALSILLAGSPHGQISAALMDPVVWSNLVPALAFVAALFLAIRWFHGIVGMLAAFAFALLGFYACLSWLGIDSTEARDLHLLPNFGGDGPLGIARLSLGEVDWNAVAYATPIIASVALINLVAVLLNITGIELALESEVKVDHELKIVGATNLLVGAFGCVAAFAQGGANIFAGRMGAQRGALSAGFLLVLGPACFFATTLAGAVPIFVATGLLIFIGITMIESWLFQTRRRLRAGDWTIICGIVAVTLVLGILPAVLVGLFLAVLSFAITSARLPVVDFITDGRARRSVVDRSLEEDGRLSQHGNRIQILHLQGALFFGSVENMITITHRLLLREPQSAFVILDCEELDLIDSSACAGLAKLRQLLARRGVIPLLAGLSEANRRALEQWAVQVQDSPDRVLGIRTAATLDEALEACENELLDHREPMAGRSLDDLLAELSDSHPRRGDLLQRMTRMDLAPGDRLIRQGDPTTDIFFVEYGRLSVSITSPAGASLRVRSLGPGAVVGEMAHILDLPRSTEVMAATACVVHRLDEQAVSAILRDDPELSALLYKVLAHALALKLLKANVLIGDMRAPRLRPPSADQRTAPRSTRP
ncbi:SLC26A/SulP transporter family protein [Paracoccus zhejiangensis]|nr:cyclic nucleotide-binding domain-containing protein [Paracoccus zhejiangensis]